MRKSVKSLQIVLNELFMDNHINTMVTNSAFTQARQKLSHTAFLALNQDIVAMQYENPKDLNLWNGYRLLGVDASQIILPNTKEIAVELKLNPRAIDGMRDTLFTRLDAKSRVGLAMYSIKHGIMQT
jgi:hypothetical protein